MVSPQKTQRASDCLFPTGRNRVIYYLFGAQKWYLLSERQIWWFVISHIFPSLQRKRRWPLTRWADHSARERYFPGFCPQGTFTKNWPVSEQKQVCVYTLAVLQLPLRENLKCICFKWHTAMMPVWSRPPWLRHWKPLQGTSAHLGCQNHFLFDSKPFGKLRNFTTF